MTLKFMFKRVYGKPKFYPISPAAETLVRFQDLSKICLSRSEIKFLLKLSVSGAVFNFIDEEENQMSIKDVAAVLKAD